MAGALTFGEAQLDLVANTKKLVSGMKAGFEAVEKDGLESTATIHKSFKAMYVDIDTSTKNWVKRQQTQYNKLVKSAVAAAGEIQAAFAAAHSGTFHGAAFAAGGSSTGTASRARKTSRSQSFSGEKAGLTSVAVSAQRSAAIIIQSNAAVIASYRARDAAARGALGYKHTTASLAPRGLLGYGGGVVPIGSGRDTIQMKKLGGGKGFVADKQAFARGFGGATVANAGHGQAYHGFPSSGGGGAGVSGGGVAAASAASGARGPSRMMQFQRGAMTVRRGLQDASFGLQTLGNSFTRFGILAGITAGGILGLGGSIERQEVELEKVLATAGESNTQKVVDAIKEMSLNTPVFYKQLLGLSKVGAQLGFADPKSNKALTELLAHLQVSTDIKDEVSQRQLGKYFKREGVEPDKMYNLASALNLLEDTLPVTAREIVEQTAYMVEIFAKANMSNAQELAASGIMASTGLRKRKAATGARYWLDIFNEAATSDIADPKKDAKTREEVAKVDEEILKKKKRIALWEKQKPTAQRRLQIEEGREWIADQTSRRSMLQGGLGTARGAESLKILLKALGISKTSFQSQMQGGQFLALLSDFAKTAGKGGQPYQRDILSLYNAESGDRGLPVAAGAAMAALKDSALDIREIMKKASAEIGIAKKDTTLGKEYAKFKETFFSKGIILLNQAQEAFLELFEIFNPIAQKKMEEWGGSFKTLVEHIKNNKGAIGKFFKDFIDGVEDVVTNVYPIVKTFAVGIYDFVKKHPDMTKNLVTAWATLAAIKPLVAPFYGMLQMGMGGAQLIQGMIQLAAIMKMSRAAGVAGAVASATPGIGGGMVDVLFKQRKWGDLAKNSLQASKNIGKLGVAAGLAAIATYGFYEAYRSWKTGEHNTISKAWKDAPAWLRYGPGLGLTSIEWLTKIAGNTAALVTMGISEGVGEGSVKGKNYADIVARMDKVDKMTPEEQRAWNARLPSVIANKKAEAKRLADAAKKPKAKTPMTLSEKKEAKILATAEAKKQERIRVARANPPFTEQELRDEAFLTKDKSVARQLIEAADALKGAAKTQEDAARLQLLDTSRDKAEAIGRIHQEAKGRRIPEDWDLRRMSLKQLRRMLTDLQTGGLKGRGESYFEGAGASMVKQQEYQKRAMSLEQIGINRGKGSSEYKAFESGMLRDRAYEHMERQGMGMRRNKPWLEKRDNSELALLAKYTGEGLRDYVKMIEEKRTAETAALDTIVANSDKTTNWIAELIPEQKEFALSMSESTSNLAKNISMDMATTAGNIEAMTLSTIEVNDAIIDKLNEFVQQPAVVNIDARTEDLPPISEWARQIGNYLANQTRDWMRSTGVDTLFTE